MFKSALVKLTSIYLGVIMAISLFFSFTIYHQAARELGRGYRDQVRVIGDSYIVPMPVQQRLNESRRMVLDEARASLLSSLLFTNFAILLLGGVLSYVLAQKTLDPIEKAHQSLEQFTSDASHELRTPLAAMKSEIEVTLMQADLSVDEARAVLESNLEEVDALTKLSSNLLSIARLEEPDLEIVICNLALVAESAIRKVGKQARQRAISIELRPIKQEIKAYADKSSLEQSLVALLDNAIKYSPKRSTIFVGIGSKKGVALVSVKDEGMGIPKAEQAKIFQRFYQANNARSKASGSSHGLGLAIAQSLVERQSGTIGVSSREGRGSTFTISLPKA